MEQTFKDIEFDIILDDGSHICSDVIETFKIMFPKIKNDGLYTVENLHTSYWDVYGSGCREKGAAIEYFKDFVEVLNSDYICAHQQRSIDFLVLFSQNIESIAFYDSICSVKKFSNPKNTPFKLIISGNEDIGGVTCFKNEEEFIQNVRNMFGE